MGAGSWLPGVLTSSPTTQQNERGRASPNRIADLLRASQALPSPELRLLQGLATAEVPSAAHQFRQFRSPPPTRGQRIDFGPISTRVGVVVTSRRTRAVRLSRERALEGGVVRRSAVCREY